MIRIRTVPKVCAMLAGVAAWALASAVLAGEQKYEPLSASVRTALHRSVADQASPRLAFASQAEGSA